MYQMLAKPLAYAITTALTMCWALFRAIHSHALMQSSQPGEAMEAQRGSATNAKSPRTGTPEAILLTPSAAPRDAESFFMITVWRIQQPPYLGEYILPRPLWLPETEDSMEPYIYSVFFLCIHTYDKV